MSSQQIKYIINYYDFQKTQRPLIMPTLLDDFKIGMERLDVRDFHKKKIWHGFEYFKSDRKKGVKVSIILGYNEGYDNFHIDSFFASLYFKSIESARCPLLNKYHIVGGNTVSTLTHSFMKELEGCELRISQPEHIDILVNKIQCILNEKIWPYIDQYSNIEEVAKEIASKKRDELPFDIAYAGPHAAAMLFLKQTNSPAYEEKLIETVNGLKQYVISDVAEHGSLAEGSARVLKMVEEQLHDDLEKGGYEFYKG